MSNFNVENFNYDYAHKCYMAYAAGNTSAADSMYEKGKEVAESKKWLAYVTKWQTEDVTVYDMDEGIEKGADAKSGLGGAATTGAIGAAAAGGLSAGATATTTTVTTTTFPLINITEAGVETIQTEVQTTSTSASTGALVSAILYFAVGLIFLGLTAAFKVKAANGRKEQEAYMKSAEQIMQYDIGSKLAEAQEMNNEILAFSEEAAELTKAANVNVAASNAVAEATNVSNQSVSVAAKANASEDASKIISDLDSLDTGILDKLPELDTIFGEIQAQKEKMTLIREEIPKFEKLRKEQLIMMSILTGAGALGAIGGGIGLGLAWTNYLAAPVAMAFFIAGIAAFVAAAIVAATEISPQNKAKQKLENEDTPKVNTGLENAEKALTAISQDRNAGLTREAAVVQMGEEMREEDTNVNVGTGTGKAA